MPAPDFLAFLDRSLRLLAAEAPEAMDALLAETAGLRLRLEAASARATLWVTPAGVEIFAPGPPAPTDVFISFEDRVILDLVDGVSSLDEAVTAERLHLRGPVDAVERLLAGLAAYLKGAVRSPGMARLLAEYRLGAARG